MNKEEYILTTTLIVFVLMVDMILYLTNTLDTKDTAQFLFIIAQSIAIPIALRFISLSQRKKQLHKDDFETNTKY